MYVFSGKDVSVYIQLTDTPVVMGKVFPRDLPFIPLIYVDNISINIQKGVDIVWILGRRNIGGVIPVSLPPATVSINFPYIDDEQLYLLITSLQRRPHKKFIQMKVVFCPDLLGREFVIEFQNGMSREVDINFVADRWGTVNTSFTFPFALLRFSSREYTPLFLPPPPLPKGYRVVFEFYPEGSDEPLGWISSGAATSFKFSLITEVNFDYTFPSLQSFFPYPHPQIPYNAPSVISEGKHYIQGSITTLLPAQWTLQHGTFGGITGTLIDEGTVSLSLLNANFKERVRWTLYHWVPKNLNFSVSPNNEVKFSTDFVALNFEFIVFEP